MSPIIDLQRRMVEAGRIRAGDKSDKGAPRKLKNWRLTSRDEVRLNKAAKMWGGGVTPWEGQFELYTNTDTLPVMLLPDIPVTTWYELWSKGGCQRRCDGISMNSEEACVCDPDDRECKPYTRLSVLLPDLPGIGSWLVTSTGWNAAAELAGSANLLQRASAQGVLLPARLRLEQRTEVKAGQTRHFAVPVLDIDVSFRELLAGSGTAPSPGPQALPAGYTPIEAKPSNGGSLAEGLAEAETQQVKRTQRSAVPIPEDDEILEQDTGEPSGATSEASASSPSAGAEPAAPAESGASPVQKPTPGQKKKIGVLLSELRDKLGVVSTEQLWANLATARNVEVDVMIELLKGRDDEGVLHFGPLLADMDRKEAARLIDWFERVEAAQV